ncbi:threonine ammonia-lyase [Larkinella soli]|uniref:threonine ammonia-lyase n=1 Tax=Larkinella soli TaxID=1770527 RepID=UPI000FFB2C4F|nr:threonine/serine dehydratase [Larkinella soli]
MITPETIRAAHERIRPHIHRTPVLTSDTVDRIGGARVFFKPENFQKIGAFKARGGLNAVLQLLETEQKAGRRLGPVTTHSSGNHAQAVAFAARQVGVKAFIVMPRTAPSVKKAAVRAYGAEIIECEPTLEAREEGVREVIERTGATLIHPFDDDRVIAGQATAAWELIEDAGNDQPFDFLMAPVGGGGLLSGTGLSAHFLSPTTQVVAAEPDGAADAVLSFSSGRVEKAPVVNTIADGLLTTLSDRTLAYIREHVTDILTVSDAEIVAAMRLLWERMKIVVEPSGAVPLAALLKHPDRFAGRKVGIILSGGNVDLGKLPFSS